MSVHLHSINRYYKRHLKYFASHVLEALSLCIHLQICVNFSLIVSHNANSDVNQVDILKIKIFNSLTPCWQFVYSYAEMDDKQKDDEISSTKFIYKNNNFDWDINL